jgi:hypothetical protein
MSQYMTRVLAVGLTVLSLAACAPAVAPAGTPSPSNVNPITGARGGTNGGGAASH